MALTNSQVVSGPKSRPVVPLAPDCYPTVASLVRNVAQALGPVSGAVFGVVEGPPLGLGFRVGVGCRAVSFAYALTRQLALQETASARARRSRPAGVEINPATGG